MNSARSWPHSQLRMYFTVAYKGRVTSPKCLRKSFIVPPNAARNSKSAISENGNWNPGDHLNQRHGQEMLKMITDPMNYRPGGGETTFEMRDRVMAWFQARKPIEGAAVAISHGGPIAALLGTLRRLAVADWIPLIPVCGQVLCSADVPLESGSNVVRRCEFV